MAQVIETRVSIVCDVCKDTKVTYDDPVEVGKPGADKQFIELSIRHKTGHVCKKRCADEPLSKIAQGARVHFKAVPVASTA